MKYFDVVRRAGRNLRQAKIRTLLTSFAIAVGAFTLTLSLALGEGVRSYVGEVMETNINAQMLMIGKDKSMMSFSGGSESGGVQVYDDTAIETGGRKFKSLSAEDMKNIQSTEGVESAEPVYNVSVKYFTLEGNTQKFVSPVYQYDPSVKSAVAAGSLPDLNKQIGDDEIIVPESSSKTMGVQNPMDLIGKTITLRVEKPLKQPTEDEIKASLASPEGMAQLSEKMKAEYKDVPLKIRAVSAKSSTSFSTSYNLYMSANKAKELAEYTTQGTSHFQQYMAASAIVKKGVDPTVVKDRLAKKDIFAMTAKELQGMLFNIVNIMQAIVAFFGVLALIASVFGIINTQYISVLERTSQIGLMKALGMSRRTIGKLFRYEAAWIGLLGAIIGSGVAVIGGTIANPHITEAIGLESSIHLLKFVWWQIGLLVFALVMVAIIAGWFPSRKAAKLDPIEALRTE